MSRLFRVSKKAEEVSFKCPFDGRSFGSQYDLDAHVDTDHQGRLEKNASTKGAQMSSRLFARRKKEIEDEILEEVPVTGEAAEPGDAPLEEPMDAPAPEPVPAATAEPAVSPTPSAGNPYASLPTEALTAVIEALSNIKDFQTNPSILQSIEQVAEELKNRPMQPEVAPKAAARKQAVTPPGWEHAVKEMKKDKDVDNPWALANWMKDEGYTPHKASFLIRRGRGKFLQAKFAAAQTAGAVSNFPPVNEDTLNKVDGQPHEVPEINEAHSSREGVEQAEKHNNNPGKSVTEIKDPQSLNKQAKETEISSALKTAESIEKKLGALYLDAKPITRANASAQVTAAVESIYDAMNKFAEAKKVLNKHEMQAANEEEAIKSVEKKEKKAFALTLAACE